jgi:hypothetical protein
MWEWLEDIDAEDIEMAPLKFPLFDEMFDRFGLDRAR